MSTLEFNNTLINLQQNLRLFALSFTKNEENADDLVQETNLRAFRYRNQYKAQTNFKAWVFTIMRNQFINEYRKKSRRKTVFDASEDSFILNNHTEDRQSPSTYLTKKEVDQQINRLDAEYRTPFLMHFEGYKYKEISEKMNIPIGTVKSRIFIARQRLMKLLPDFQHN